MLPQEGHCICSMATIIPIKHNFLPKVCNLFVKSLKPNSSSMMPFHTKHRRWGKGLRNEWHGGGAQGLRNDPTSIQNKKSDFFWMPHSTLDLVYSLKWPLDAIQGRWGELHNVFNFFKWCPSQVDWFFEKLLQLPMQPCPSDLVALNFLNTKQLLEATIASGHSYFHQCHHIPSINDTKKLWMEGIGGAGTAELFAPLNCILNFVNDAASPGWLFLVTPSGCRGDWMWWAVQHLPINVCAHA